jgi:hypothetical protein
MSCRDIYVRIEKLPGYSPVAPENGEHGKYGRDCMRMHGHEDGRIPQAEIERLAEPVARIREARRIMAAADGTDSWSDWTRRLNAHRWNRHQPRRSQHSCRSEVAAKRIRRDVDFRQHLHGQHAECT